MSPGETASNFAHLASLTDERGVFEHALGDRPRRECGYCVDDVSRALLVLIREPEPTPLAAGLIHTCFRFVASAVSLDGRIHNRMSPQGRWVDAPGVGDWWGRALWSLGVAAAGGPTASMRDLAGRLFRRAASAPAVELHTLAYAAMGAAELISVRPGDASAIALARDAAAALSVHHDAGWPWPEPRLRYANAALAEGLLAAGACLGKAGLIDRGLDMLGFLLQIETRDGHLSVTGTSGRGAGDHGVQFDQQPIEVAAIAEACARAFDLTGDAKWRDAVALAWAWFEGENDTGVRMYDPDTGAGYDGLTPTGRNNNRGAESTLAALGTRQQARRLAVIGRVAP